MIDIGVLAPCPLNTCIAATQSGFWQYVFADGKNASGYYLVGTGTYTAADMERYDIKPFVPVKPPDKDPAIPPDEVQKWSKPDPSGQTGRYWRQYFPCAAARFSADVDVAYLLPKVGVFYWGVAAPWKATVSAATSLLTDYHRGREAAAYCSAASGVYLGSRSGAR